MPEGTYTMLKPKNGEPLWPKPFEPYKPADGAYYYVYSNVGSVATYKKASAIIILPTSMRLKGIGRGRNAYISFGIEAGADALDIGIRNVGENETDEGLGWEPYALERNQIGGDHLFPNNRAPAGTTKAKVEVTPNLTNRNKIRLSVQWLSASNSVLGNFDEEIPLTKTFRWNNFFRFASLVTYYENSSRSDGTHLLGGGFDSVKLGTNNWGISTDLVSYAWIANHPKCDLPYGYWATGEEFRIEHWV